MEAQRNRDSVKIKEALFRGLRSVDDLSDSELLEFLRQKLKRIEGEVQELKLTTAEQRRRTNHVGETRKKLFQ